MRDPISKELVSDIENLLQKHGVENLYWADTLGQALDQLKGQCLGNNVPWCNTGIVASYLRRHGAIETLKKLITKLDKKRLNYNDMDCDIWARHIEVPMECLKCSSIVSKVDPSPNTPKSPAECDRCKGTAIDPECHDDVWILVDDDHGNGKVFIIEENCLSDTLSVRDLPYNQSRKQRVKVLNEMIAEVPKGMYDSPHELIRYRDSRDKGFVLTIRFDKKDGSHNGEVSLRAACVSEIIAEHFPCLLGDEVDGEIEDTKSIAH